MHGLSNLEEACNVSTKDVVTITTVFLCSFVGCLVNADHDRIEFLINFLAGP